MLKLTIKRKKTVERLKNSLSSIQLFLYDEAIKVKAALRGEMKQTQPQNKLSLEI